ncbi:NB-ARC domain-containing protein [Altericista sp. CCNU0014]|uniref:WD40 domain-containing protein n=1 Tax=Altericista sp. CCNU0014 TaxID=3082949 RepID=UPI0038507F9E
MESVEEALAALDAALTTDGLSNLQELIVRGCWEGQTYTQIAETTGYDDDYIRDVGFQLWRKLSQSLNEKVSKSNFKTVLRRRERGQRATILTPVIAPSRFVDWGTAADVPVFFGRDREFTTLTPWIKENRCRLISILGMGGMGKTSFTIRFAQTLQDEFEVLIWRSLKAAPPLGDLLNNLLKVLAPSPEKTLPDNTPGKLEQLIEYLRQSRCLIILDNFDVLLQGEQLGGVFQPAYEDYGELLQYVGEIAHNSCVLITSREKPQGIDGMEGDRLPVRTLYLNGLDPAASAQILRQKELSGTEQDFQRLIDYYRGHPLALKIISTSIRDLFDGNIAQFLQQGSGVFNGLQKLLVKQLERLSALEQAILYWLAINSEPVSFAQLLEDLVPEPTKSKLLEALESLKRRSLIETAKAALTLTLSYGKKEQENSLANTTTDEQLLPPSPYGRGVGGEGQSIRFTLQPVIMECLIDELIQRVCSEIKAIAPQAFLSHALVKAQIEDNLRDCQTRLILDPLATRLMGHFGSAIALSQQLHTLRQHLQTLPTHQIGYGGGNLLNLFRHLKTDLVGQDFSGLTLRQAILHDISLRRTNFTQATFRQCSFANTFGGITHLAFSPDGNRFATCDSNGNVALWSVNGMHPTAKCIGHDFWTWAVAFSPNSALLASCGQDQTIRLWDTATGHCHKILKGHTNIVTDVTFSPDGLSLLSCSTDGTVKQWNLSTGNCMQTFLGHEKCVWGAVFAPDGQHFYSGGEDNCIRYWDLHTGTCLKVFTGHTQWIMAIALSPDGLQLASASMDGTLKLWCTATATCLHTLSGHQAPVLSVAFSPKGRTLASGSYDRTVRLWNARTGICTQILNKHTNRIWCVKFHPKGNLLASGGDDHTARFWNSVTGDPTNTLQGHSNGIYAIALHPNGTLLASAHEDQTVRLWPVPSSPLEPHKSLDKTGDSAFDPPNPLKKGELELKVPLFKGDLGGSKVSNGPTDRERYAFAPPNPIRPSLEPFQTLRGHQNRILAIAFSPDGHTLASGSLDRTIKLWNPETYQCRLTLQGHQSWIWDVAFHPNSKTLASASYDRTVKLWDLKTGHCTHTLEGHLGSALSVAFSPDGQWLASGGYEQMLKLWHPESGECVHTWYAHPNRVWAVAFSPNSQWLATAGEDGNIILWDVETGDRLQTLSGHSQSVLCLRFSADGRQLFSSSGDRTVKQWDLQTGQCLQTLSGHDHWAWSLALVSAHILLSGSQDETIQCWDLTTGEPLQRLEVPRPYAGMNISDTQGLTDAQRQTLTVLGAICNRTDEFLNLSQNSWSG